MERRQGVQKERHDRKAKARTIGIGDVVFVRNYRSGSKWLQGKVVNQVGESTQMYLVQLNTGQKRRYRLDQMRIGVDVAPSDSEDMEPNEEDWFLSAVNPSSRGDSPVVGPSVDNQSAVRTYPSRARGPPDWYVPL